MDNRLTKKEFMNQPEMKRVKGNITASAGFLYMCSVISFLLVVVLQHNLFAIVDVALVLGLALGIHLAYSRVCAIAVMVYAVFNLIVSIATTGRANGYLIVLAAVYAIMATYQFKKNYDHYLETGEIADIKKEK